jgi:cytochrome c556
MNRYRLTGLAVALALGLVMATCWPRDEQGPDMRTAVRIPLEGRDAILTEMRAMLGSVNGVLTALVRDDTTAVRTAAQASGVAMAADPALERYLPAPFLQLGVKTHQQFDSLAAGPAVKDTVLVRLARITGNCVSCHMVYRLRVE